MATFSYLRKLFDNIPYVWYNGGMEKMSVSYFGNAAHYEGLQINQKFAGHYEGAKKNQESITKGEK